MFDETKEVPSLGLCERLKELGYPQNTMGFYWIKFSTRYNLYYQDVLLFDEEGKIWGVKTVNGLTEPIETIKAPTQREIEEWLPDEIVDNGFWGLIMTKNYIGYGRPTLQIEWLRRIRVNYEPVNARAELLIWLRENGYVKFEKERK